jgi:hypothetical protein
MKLLSRFTFISFFICSPPSKDKHRFFSFYDVEASKLLDDFILVEKFPDGCAVAFYGNNSN